MVQVLNDTHMGKFDWVLESSFELASSYCLRHLGSEPPDGIDPIIFLPTSSHCIKLVSFARANQWILRYTVCEFWHSFIFYHSQKRWSRQFSVAQNKISTHIHKIKKHTHTQSFALETMLRFVHFVMSSSKWHKLPEYFAKPDTSKLHWSHWGWLNHMSKLWLRSCGIYIKSFRRWKKSEKALKPAKTVKFWSLIATKSCNHTVF